MYTYTQICVIRNDILQWRHDERWCLHSPASQLFAHLFVQEKIKEMIEAALLAFVTGIHRWPVDFPHKRSVIWKMFPFDDGIMKHDLNWYEIDYRIEVYGIILRGKYRHNGLKFTLNSNAVFNHQIFQVHLCLFTATWNECYWWFVSTDMQGNFVVVWFIF